MSWLPKRPEILGIIPTIRSSSKAESSVYDWFALFYALLPMPPRARQSLYLTELAWLQWEPWLHSSPWWLKGLFREIPSVTQARQWGAGTHALDEKELDLRVLKAPTFWALISHILSADNDQLVSKSAILCFLPGAPGRSGVQNVLSKTLLCSFSKSYHFWECSESRTSISCLLSLRRYILQVYAPAAPHSLLRQHPTYNMGYC